MATVTLSGKDNGCYILKKLCSAWNCEPVNAVGSVGCFWCESHCNPASYNKQEKAGTFTGSSANGSGYGAGLALWSNTWKTEILQKFKRYTPIETWTMDQLIEVVILTCKSSFVNDLKASKTATASTDKWLRGYENGYAMAGGGYASVEQLNKYTWGGGYNGLLSARVTAAVEILKEYQGGNVGDDVVGDISDYGSTSGSGAVPSDWDGTTVSSSYSSVLSSSSDNIYSALTVDTDNSIKHTRIYQYSKSTITVDELSLPVDDSSSSTTETYNSTSAYATSGTTATSTSNGDGTSTLELTEVKTSETKDANGEIVIEDTNTVVLTTGITSDKPEMPGTRGDSGEDPLASAGVTYPLIRINDHYFSPDEIKSFELSTIGFVPTAKLHFVIKSTTMLKNNIVKDGDMMAVFVQPTTAAYKSLRCDFLITTCISNEIISNVGTDYDFVVSGELYIPDLYNANMTFAFSGSSRDALIYCAEQLKLSFFFNDPENTNDEQMWYCTTNMPDEDINRPSNIKEFILDVCSHSWKNFESFFDCWIDPRYGLSFININKQLVENGPDEKIDIVPFQNAILSHRGKDAKRGLKTDTEAETDVDKGVVWPQGKIITNISTDNDANSPLYAISFKETNQSGEISRIMGINLTVTFTNGNWSSGDGEPKQFTMSYSMPYNDWKMQHGFYLLIGPARNDSYVPGDSYEDFVKSNNKKVGGNITDILADSDGETIVDTGDNMLATGAVNKFYDAAVNHNRINLLLLLKKYITVELNGFNFAIMRGEKIPCMIVDLDKANNLEFMNNNDIVTSLIYENMSGWFIIDSIKYVFDVNNSNEYGTLWRTIVKLVRREWPISGKSVCPDASSDSSSSEVTIKNDVNAGSSVESSVSDTTDTSSSDSESTEDNAESDGVSANGLNTNLTKTLSALLEFIPDAQLLRGRYYAVERGSEAVIDSYALPNYVTTTGLYIVANEKKEIKLVSLEYAQRFYGEAMNLVSLTRTPEEMLLAIIYSDEMLDVMYKYGLAPTITTITVDDSPTKTLLITQSYMEFVKIFWSNVFILRPDVKLQYENYYVKAANQCTRYVTTSCKDADGNTVKVNQLLGID